MSKVNVTPDQFGNLVVSFLLDKMLHPEEVIPGNKDFNVFAEKMAGKGMKPLALNYYLRMNAVERVYYKRIKKVFEYDQNQSAVIFVWPSKGDIEKAEKKDNLLKRAIKKLLFKEDINKEERQLLMEEITDEHTRED
ncbi:MAG: hypothetical protein ABH873_02790 [Candidatus Firestonebacteria bacterium]